MTKYILVSGASKGIGRAIVLHLTQAGFNVFAGVRKPEDGKALQAEAGERCTPVILDVTRAEQIEAVRALITAQVGEAGLFGLVNNAGIAVGAPMEFMPMEDLRWQFDVNFFGQVAVTQAFVELLRAGKGRIINISSIGGRVTAPILGAYSASKFALEAITTAFRLELSVWGIDAIAIEPGRIKTPIWDSGASIADGILAKLPPRAHELYGRFMEAGKRDFMTARDAGADPLIVAKVVHRALTVKNPRTRYLVGKDAKFVGHVLLRIPDRIRERFIKLV